MAEPLTEGHPKIVNVRGVKENESAAYLSLNFPSLGGRATGRRPTKDRKVRDK